MGRPRGADRVMLSDRCQSNLKRSIMRAREENRIWGFEARELIRAFGLKAA